MKNPIRPFAAVCITMLAACSPSPQTGAVTAAAPTAASVDTARLLRDLQVLADDSLRGRRAGSAGNLAARRYIEARFGALGLRPFGSGFASAPFTFRARDSSTVTGVNAVGYVRGTTYPERYIVVSAHFDHVGVGRPVGGDSIYNGADDNASGTATLLELARHFAARPPAHSIVFAALDAEEMGLQGARAFVASPPIARGAILLNVNLDMVSRNDRGELYAAGTFHTPRLRTLLEPVAARAPVQLRFGHDDPKLGASQDWTTQSDHGAFHAAGIPFVYFGVEDHADYHQPGDEAGRVPAPFFGRSAATILDAVRTLDAALAGTPLRPATGGAG